MTTAPTPDATNTPRPTATQRPTPTATAPPSEAAVEIAQWHRVERQYTDGVTIVGVLVNTGNATASEVNVVASVYDANGVILGSEESWTVAPILPAGAKGPFEIRITSIDTAAVDDSKTVVQGQYVTMEPDSFEAEYYTTDGLVVTQLQWTLERISGEVRNDDSETVENVRILVVGYDAAGNVVTVESLYADLDQLSPGQSSPFSAAMYQGYDAPVSSEWQVYANPLD
jgi:hypothetical protein